MYIVFVKLKRENGIIEIPKIFCQSFNTKIFSPSV